MERSSSVRLSPVHLPGSSPPVNWPLASVMLSPPKRQPLRLTPSCSPSQPEPVTGLLAAGLPPGLIVPLAPPEASDPLPPGLSLALLPPRFMPLLGAACGASGRAGSSRRATIRMPRFLNPSWPASRGAIDSNLGNSRQPRRLFRTGQSGGDFRQAGPWTFFPICFSPYPMGRQLQGNVKIL